MMTTYGRFDLSDDAVKSHATMVGMHDPLPNSSTYTSLTGPFQFAKVSSTPSNLTSYPCFMEARAPGKETTNLTDLQLIDNGLFFPLLVSFVRAALS